MYLLDTNVWLERLLNQERSDEVGSFLNTIPTDRLYITDFSFHSIGIVLHRLNRRGLFLRFVRDAFIHGSVNMVHLQPADADNIVTRIEQFKLDFDDAYQYVAAEKYGYSLISFDSDFDKTTLGRKTPRDIK